MADDLDRFVLQYSVDLKDSVKRLEMLQDKMKKTGDASKKSGSALKSFAADATGELGKLVPGLDAVSAAVKAMGAEFALATAALGALAIGVKAVMDLRNQYNAQRGAGMQVGVSGARIEDYQRKFVRASGGYVDRDKALEGVKTFADMTNAAYADPSRLGKEARVMRMLGVNVGERGQMPTGLNDTITQLARGLQGKSSGDVQGIAKATGMNQDWLLTLQKLGTSVGQITDLTNDEIESRKKAEDAVSNLNKSTAELTAQYLRAENALGEHLLPTFTKFVDLLAGVAGTVPKAVDNLSKQGVGHITRMSDAEMEKQRSQRHGFIGWMKNTLGIYDATAAQEDHKPQKSASEKAQKEKKEQDKRDAAVDKMDEQNKTGIQTANQMNLAVNMFAGAVQSFSSAINLQQAWAAWAGEIGNANGLPGSSGASADGLSGGGSGNWRGNQYADLIKKAADQYHEDPQMLHAIMMAESHGQNGQYSSTGAGGLMQVTKGNWRAYGGGKDVMDPAANIMVGARIYADMLKRNHGDTEAALKDYNGSSDPNYVSKVAGFYGGSATGMGESKAKMNIRSVQQQIADYLHVPLDQVQRGGVSKGDAAWAVQQLEAGMSNNLYGLKQRASVAGLPSQDYAQLKLQMRDQSRGYDLMRQYADGVVGKQQAGGRERTIGEQQIVQNFTINGVTDPKAVADEINRQIKKGMNEVLMNYATGEKG